MLADGNPAELWEAAGEELEEARRPQAASLEACDLGLGPGVVKGAYAKLPRYFKDTGRVMDAEQRLMYCRMTLQGLTKEEASARPFSSPGKASEIERLMAYVASELRARPSTFRSPTRKKSACTNSAAACSSTAAARNDFACATPCPAGFA